MMELLQFEDHGLNFHWEKVFNWLKEEDENQILKWGYQIHSSFQWLTYTTEELGSLAKAIGEFEHRDGLKEKVVNEAVQVATLAIKIAIMFSERR